MNIPRPIHALATAFLVSSALTLSLTAHAGKGDKPPKPGGGLNLINSLLSESGVTQGIAEGNELLTFSIIVSNPSKKAKVTDVIEVVPEGTSYAGGDDFASACRTGAAAGARCAIKVSVPGKSRVNLRFNINVDDPVTTFFINNEVTASAVDCSTNDCSELMYTAGIGTSSGFRIVSGADWTETSVRKVLHAFAYGGLTSDAQIAAWAAMSPAVAIEQMLDFSYTNELLSPRSC